MSTKKNHRKRKSDMYLDLAREPETMEHVGDSDNNCKMCAGNDHQKLDKGAEKVGNRRMTRDHSNYWIIEIDQNIEKNPGDMR